MKNKNKITVDFLNFANRQKKPNRLLQKVSLVSLMLGIFLFPQVGYFSSITPEKIIELTNKERITANLKPLTASQLLTKAAYLKGQAIIETQTFQHTIGEKKFSGWVREAGYDYSFVGENLAIDFMTSEGIIEAWMKSPTHKSNLLNSNFTEIGIAVIEGVFQGQNSVIIVQIFGSPPLATAIANETKNLATIKNSGIMPAQNTDLNSYSTPIIYISNEPVKDVQQFNYLIINFLNTFYVLRFLPMIICALCAFALFSLYLSHLMKISKPREAK